MADSMIDFFFFGGGDCVVCPAERHRCAQCRICDYLTVQLIRPAAVVGNFKHFEKSCCNLWMAFANRSDFYSIS